ncbi:MAG: sugar ABC transporter substrate-binding protein [Eubacteriales bacterium]|nr:sugar ABC transporter substrate-binding protein [Eubacteriales bacterium]
MKKLFCLVLACAMLISLAACAGTAEEESTSSAEGESVTDGSITESTAEEGEKEVINVAWIARNLTDDWYRAIYTFGCEEADRIAAEEGVEFNIVPYDSQASVEVSMQICEDILTMGTYDMIYFEAVDESAMGTMIERFNEELDCPVAGASTTAAAGQFIFCGPNNVAACENTANIMIEKLTEKYGEDPQAWIDAGGVILEMWGPAGLQICQDRHTGFHNIMDPILAEYPELQVVQLTSNWEPERAFQEMTDAVQRYGDQIIAIYTDDDTAASEGAWRALENAGMGYPIGDERHIPIVTYDGTYNAIGHVVEGHIDLVIEQPAVALASMAMRYMWIWYKEGYDALPQPGTVLSEEDMREYFGDDVAVAFWSPVTVVEGFWGGLWFQPTCPLIPQTADPTNPALWGNAWYERNNGEYPEWVVVEE